MKRCMITIIISLAMLAGILNGCSAEAGEDADLSPTTFARTSDEEVLPEELPDDALGCLIAPQVVGEVLEVKDDGMLILVDAKNETGDQIEGEIWVAITDETYFFEDVDENSSLGDMKDISRDFKVGNKVSILTGDIAESYPMQTQAISVYENKEQ